MLTSSALSFRPRAVYAVVATAVVAATLAVAAPANADLTFGSFATQGDASAGWVNEPNAPPGATDQQSIALFVNGSSSTDFNDAARVVFTGRSGPPLADAPTFDFKTNTIGVSGGSVRFVIRWSDGGLGELRPLHLGPGAWTHVDGAGPNWDNRGGICGFVTSKTYDEMRDCHPGALVTGVEVVNDSGWLYTGGFQVLVDNVSYAGGTVSVPPPPVEGETVGLAKVSGQVVVRYPGRRRKGRIVRLQGNAPIPIESVVDSRKGRVRLVSSRGGNRRQRAIFRSGVFRVKQKKGEGGVTDIVLRGGLFGCTAAAAGTKAEASVLSRRRRLWGRGRGRYRTRGLYSSGSVRGTIWLTEDTCEGTTTFVVRGVVMVTDFTTGETHAVHAGERYFASRGN